MELNSLEEPGCGLASESCPACPWVPGEGAGAWAMLASLTAADPAPSYVSVVDTYSLCTHFLYLNQWLERCNHPAQVQCLEFQLFCSLMKRDVKKKKNRMLKKLYFLLVIGLCFDISPIFSCRDTNSLEI